MKHYIAFSIHGTNCFISASTEKDSVVAKTEGLRRAGSRRPNYKSDQEAKYTWDKLNKKDGNPHTSPAWVLRRFNELKKLGWVVDDQRFREKHFGKKA